MRSTLIGIVAALAAAPTALAAQVRPQAGTGDPRVQTVDYVEEQVVLLRLLGEAGVDVRLSTRADRATLANMSPEFGSTCAVFPIDRCLLRDGLGR